MKKIARFGLALFLFLSLAGVATAALPTGFGKARWGMTEQELLTAYDLKLNPPKRMDDTGPWAIEGPAPGELTVSGAALGEPDVRSVSLGFHPEWGLTIIHIRFRNANKPGEVETLLPKWTGSYGKPKEELPGPRVIWEDGVTHIEMTYHTVSPRHPTPSDHVALVLWNIPLMDKITASEAPPRPPDVETLAPVERHQKPE